MTMTIISGSVLEPTPTLHAISGADHWKRASDGVWWSDAIHSTIFANPVQTNHTGILHVCLPCSLDGEHFEDHLLVWKPLRDSAPDPEHPDEPHHVCSYSSLRQDQQQRVLRREKEGTSLHRLRSRLLLAVDRLPFLFGVRYVRSSVG